MKQLLLIPCLAALSLNAYGQNHSGIYMNPSDYKSNKLTYEEECAKEKHNQNIHLHDFFGNMPNITVIYEGKKLTLRKNNVFGFRDCENEVYRFYKNEVYHIAEAGDIYIYIYTQKENVTQGKGYKIENKYYFSTSADGAIMKLTLGNLKNAYHNNDKFLDLLDQFFKGKDINEYDNIHKTFKVNYVYTKAMKQ